MRNALIGLLILAYLSTLAMSAGHLAQWYALSLGELPPWLAWGLAGSLEFTAFLLSLLSNSLLRGSSWASGGALAALLLVWMGNALSMRRAAPELPLWETLAMSLFVPVGTWVVGKVVGELLAWRPPHLAGVAARGKEVAGADGHSPGQMATPLATPRTDVATREGGLATPDRTGAAQVDRGGHFPPGEAEATATLRVKRSVDMEWTLEGRAVEVVRALSAHGGPVAVARLAAELGWPRTTVRRYLERLEEEGVAIRTEEGWTLAREVASV